MGGLRKRDITYRPPENGRCPICNNLAIRIGMCRYQCSVCFSKSKTPEGLNGGWNCKHCDDRVRCLPYPNVILPYIDLRRY